MSFKEAKQKDEKICQAFADKMKSGRGNALAAGASPILTRRSILWTADEPDFISEFCDEACARRYQVKGGKFLDGDGEPYTPNWEIEYAVRCAMCQYPRA